jgi:hypothetical protein
LIESALLRDSPVCLGLSGFLENLDWPCNSLRVIDHAFHSKRPRSIGLRRPGCRNRFNSGKTVQVKHINVMYARHIREAPFTRIGKGVRQCVDALCCPLIIPDYSCLRGLFL